MSCDHHDNASFWHGNASMALTRSNSCYSTASHDNHMQATLHESDWRVNIQKQAPKSTRCVPDPFLRLGVGSGDEIMPEDVGYHHMHTKRWVCCLTCK